ncbi:complement factor B-like [Enoplosus armatus]|uniref:complement factor B-like n=1 Tax=Enoplosus armatus TaxID=215367 RepID=UPI0039910280
MAFSVHWSWLAALLCLLCMGGEVRCDCTEVNMQIEGGYYTLTRQLERGSLLIYNCPEGYYPYPCLTRLCQHDDTWRPAPKRVRPQKCRIVECPDPSVLQNGNVSPLESQYFVGNETTYECFSGYTLRGSSTRICLPNGKWSGSTTICGHDSEDNCADPGVPPGASREGNIFGIDDTVKYSCNDNLILVGSSERVCQENGQWTGTEPACYYKHTYDTPLEVSKAFGSSIKGSLTTLEPINGTLEGKTIRISKNGTLNIYIAVDISESITPQQIDEAKKIVTALMRKIASFSVTPNYEVLFFSSGVYEVIRIRDFMNRKIVLSTVETEVTAFEVGDRNTGTDLNLVFKTFLEEMGVIKRRVGEKVFKEHRHVIIAFTDGGYNMGGSPAPTVAKIKDMVYMNHTIEGETQPREEYLDIYIFAIGAEPFDDDLQPLTTGIGKKHYFRMKDITNLEDTFDDIIDEREVLGLCGLHAEYDRKKSSKRRNYPWMAFVNVQFQGRQSKCLGSLVTPQFILTAAHCLPFGVLPEQVTVDIDDGQGKLKKVKSLKVHPNYNVNAKVNEGVKEFYDYDVALIQLNKDVQISKEVRPICIPCTQKTSDALKLDGDSTCKQQEEILFADNLQALTFLSRTGQWVKEKDVRVKIGGSRNGCIKHALEAPGITTTNPKDAVTDNFLCTGGLSPFRDHIACQGDSGGAVFKNYEQRTVQVALVSWGNKNLCNTTNMVESDQTSRDFHINLFRVVPFLKSILGNDDQDDYASITFLSR